MLNINITNARSELYKLASSCIKYNNIVNINTKEGNVILMSEEDYNNLVESLYLAGIPGIYESIEETIYRVCKEKGIPLLYGLYYLSVMTH